MDRNSKNSNLEEKKKEKEKRGGKEKRETKELKKVPSTTKGKAPVKLYKYGGIERNIVITTLNIEGMTENKELN